MPWAAKILLATACLAALAAADLAAAAEQSLATTPVASSSSDTDEVQEVSVNARRLKLDWAQRNELVQKSTTFVYGIAAVDFYKDYPPRWIEPVCLLLTGLPREAGVFVYQRVLEIARAAGAPLAGEECHPNLFIFVTSHPKELLRAMASRRFLVIFGTATRSHVDQFINEPAPVKIWHNTFQGTIGVGPVNVVVDRTRLHGVSSGQLADYLGMVSLAEIKSTAHLGDAQTILKLFDGLPQAAPEGMSDWDQAFLKILYHPERSIAIPRSNIARRMVEELVPR